MGGRGIARAAIYKCVGFTALNTGKHAGFVRFHNDSTTKVEVTILWLDPKGFPIWNEIQTLPAGWIGEASYPNSGSSGWDARVVQLTTSSPGLILDAEQMYNISPDDPAFPWQHRQVTCSPATTTTLNSGR